MSPAVVDLISDPLLLIAKKRGLIFINAWFTFAIAVLVGLLTVSPVYLILLTIAYAVWESRK